MKKKICYVKKLPLNRVYRFNPVGDREGRPSVFHHLYQDEQDFTINPVLMQQIKFEDCHETTPEGKAVWLYVRLCQLLCYDEKYFFAQTCHKPNDDIHESFKIVGNVTAETPVTCFNFSRIAVKLLNQIPGVHAVKTWDICVSGFIPKILRWTLNRQQPFIILPIWRG